MNLPEDHKIASANQNYAFKLFYSRLAKTYIPLKLLEEALNSKKKDRIMERTNIKHRNMKHET